MGVRDGGAEERGEGGGARTLAHIPRLEAFHG